MSTNTRSLPVRRLFFEEADFIEVIPFITTASELILEESAPEIESDG
jgi:hypothetical protein